MVKSFEPYLLRPKRWKHTVDTITEHIRKGHRREPAFIRAGVARPTMMVWWRKYHEELEEGLTDTTLIRFWNIILEAEAEAEADIIEILRNSALDGNIKSAMYILDKRYKWTAKQEVEVSADEDTKLQISVVNMTDPHIKPTGDDVVGNGSGDDSNTTEMD